MGLYKFAIVVNTHKLHALEENMHTHVLALAEGHYPWMAEILRQRGFEARPVKYGIRVRLKPNGSPSTYQVPPEAIGSPLRLEIEIKPTEAISICGMSGKLIKPARILRFGEKAGTAAFALPREAIAIHAYTHGRTGKVDIFHLRAVNLGREVKVIKTLIAHDAPRVVQRANPRFREGIRAAVTRARDIFAA